MTKLLSSRLMITFIAIMLCFSPQVLRANVKINSSQENLYNINDREVIRLARNFEFKPDNNVPTAQSTTTPERAFNPENSWFVGLTYPGFTAGYQGKYFGAELRGFYASDVVVYGPRFTHYAVSFNGGKLYWGADLFYISDFEGDLTEGDGTMFGGFIGIQKYLGSRISLTLDSGPYFIELEDELSGKSADNWEFVINTGINFHF